MLGVWSIGLDEGREGGGETIGVQGEGAGKVPQWGCCGESGRWGQHRDRERERGKNYCEQCFSPTVFAFY